MSEKKTRRSVRKTPPESTLESSPKENSKNIKRTHSDAKGFQKRFSVRHKQLSDQALVISPAVNALVNTLLKGREESIHVALAFIVNSRYNHHAVSVDNKTVTVALYMYITLNWCIAEEDLRVETSYYFD